MFATAVTIQAQTGSSLSEILDGLSKVIRARFRLRRKVQALSSEAKASAAIIAALPVVVALGMYFMNPDYINLLFTDRTGKLMLGGAVFWMFMGVVMMKQMINFKI
jgi:tight adherence protein B